MNPLNAFAKRLKGFRPAKDALGASSKCIHHAQWYLRGGAEEWVSEAQTRQAGKVTVTGEQFAYTVLEAQSHDIGRGKEERNYLTDKRASTWVNWWSSEEPKQ